MEGVVDVLACLPHLEFLHLDNVLEPTPAQAVSTHLHSKAVLPRLKRLFVADSAIPCARLLESLDFSAAETEINLNMTSMDVSLMAVIPMLRALVQESSPDTLILREHPDGSEFDLTTYKTSTDSHTRPFLRLVGSTATRDDFRVRVTLTSHTPPLAASHVCCGILTRLPLESVTTCSLHLSATSSDYIWDGVAQALPQITTLATAASPVPTNLEAVISMLGLRGASQPKAGKLQYRLSNVTHLTLHNVCFEVQGCHSAVDELVKLMSSRTEAGCPSIQRVALEEPCVNMSEVDVDLFRKHVQFVDIRAR